MSNTKALQVKEALKRFLSIALSVTTTVWLSGLTLLLPVSPALAVAPADYGLHEGDLIRAPSLPAPEGWAVYIINDAGFKRHIFNPEVFNMYGHLKWSNIKDVAANVSQAFTTSDLYQVAGDKRVWSTGADGVKHWVNETPAQFEAAGYHWGQIFTINDKEGAYYTAGSEITNGTPPPPPCTTNCPPSPPIAAGSLSVMVSPTTAPAGVLAAGTVYNPVLTLRLTGGSNGGTLTGLTVTRGGLLANTNVSSISVWQGSNRVSNILTSLTSTGTATFNFSTPVSVAANSSVDLDIKVGINSSATSGTVSFGINAVSDIQGATFSGTFPLNGNTFSIVAAGQLAAYTLTAQSVGGASTTFPAATAGNLDVGIVTQKELGRFQITESSGKEDLLVKQMTVYLEGSSQVGDLMNWTLYDLAGANLGAGTVSMPYVTFNLATPYRIPSGTNRTFSVKADPVNGSGRTVRVHIQNDYDLLVQGAQTMAYIAPTSFADAAPSDGYWTMKQGSLTISLSAGSPSGNVGVGATDATLARFDLRAVGEQIELRKMGFMILESVSTSTQLLTGNIKVQSDDGSQTYLSLSADTTNLQATSDTSPTRFDLNQYIVIPAGTTKTIKVLGTIKTTAGTSQTYKAEVGNFYGWRASTKDFKDPLDSTTLTKGNVLTVQSSALTVSSNPSIVGQNVALGANNVLLGSFVLQAGAAEGVSISGLGITYAGTGTASSDLTNVALCLAATTSGTACASASQFGTTVGTPSTTDSFNGSFQIPANGTQVVNILGSVKTSATAGQTMIMKVSSVSATGMITSSSITAASVGGVAVSTTPITLQTFTYQAGSLTIAKEGAPTSAIVIAGRTGVTLDRLRFTAVNDNLTLQKVRFHTTTNGSSAGGSAFIKTAYLYDGTTNLTPSGVAVTPNGTSGEMLFTGLNYSIPAGQSKYLSVVADMSSASVITAASDVGTFAVSIKSDSTTDDLQVVGTTGNLGSATIGTSSAETDLGASDVMLFQAATPVVTIASNPTGSANPQAPQANQAVFTFTVKSAGPGISLRIPRVRIKASISPVNVWSGTLGTWDLYDGSTRIASNTSVTLSSTTTSGTLTFDDNNQISSGFTTGSNSTDQTNGTFGRIADDVTGRTFTLKVDTSGIRSTLQATPGNATLTFKIDGLTGYTTAAGTSSDPYDSSATASGAGSSEDNWTGGGIFYAYLLQGGANAGTTYVGGTGVATGLTTVGDNAFNASDSYPASGQSLTY